MLRDDVSWPGRPTDLGLRHDPAEADGLIERYNAALREQLGLTETDTLEIDLPR